MPSGVITGEKKALGRTGRRPSWLVLSGASGGVEHVACVPHP